jgi:hypothetical protein
LGKDIFFYNIQHTTYIESGAFGNNVHLTRIYTIKRPRHVEVEFSSTKGDFAGTQISIVNRMAWEVPQGYVR